MGKPQKLGLQQNHQNGKTKENWVQSDNLAKTLPQPLKNFKQNQSDIKSFHQIAPPPPKKKKNPNPKRDTSTGTCGTGNEEWDKKCSSTA